MMRMLYIIGKNISKQLCMYDIKGFRNDILDSPSPTSMIIDKKDGPGSVMVSNIRLFTFRQPKMRTARQRILPIITGAAVFLSYITFSRINNLPICRFAHLPVCRFAVLAICRFANQPIHQFVDLSICRFANLLICIFADLPVQQFADSLFIQFTDLPVWQFADSLFIQFTDLGVWQRAD